MIPKITLENLKLSKMVCGTNQFVGITHRTNLFDKLAHLIRYRSANTIAEYMIFLQQQYGVNSCISSPRDKIYEAIQKTQKETGEKFHWICSPSCRLTAKDIQPNIFKQIEWCADHAVSVCIPHRNYTDKALNKDKLIIGANTGARKNNEKENSANINEKNPPYPVLSAFIRDRNMIPGLSTHYIKTIEAVEQQKYDAKLIVQPLNKIGFESDTDPETLVKKIKETKLQIINIKPMAAGRLPPDVLTWNLDNIKKNDFLAVGFGKFKYCKYDAELIDRHLNGID